MKFSSSPEDLLSGIIQIPIRGLLLMTVPFRLGDLGAVIPWFAKCVRIDRQPDCGNHVANATFGNGIELRHCGLSADEMLYGMLVIIAFHKQKASGR